MTPAFISNIGTTEIIVILVIALLLFGRRLPEVGRSLGKGIVEFKKGLRGIEDDIRDEDEDREVEKLPDPSKREPSRHEVDLAKEGTPEKATRPSSAE